MPTLSRRHFLAGSGAALVLAACSDDSPPSPEPTSTTALEGAAGLVLGEAFDRNAMLLAGVPQRLPFVLFESTGGLLPVADAPAELGVTFAKGAATVDAGRTARRGDDVDRPYYPVAATFPEAGDWSVVVDAGTGTTLESAVIVNATSSIPQLGQPMPSAATPTLADPLGVGTICTRDPVCPFHDLSLDAALAAGGPVAVLISTPEYCQVGICGPVLDLLIEAAPGRPDLAVIHIEVFTEATSSSTGPASALVSDTFGLTYEPALFVSDATGTVSARLDNIFDSVELAEALATA